MCNCPETPRCEQELCEPCQEALLSQRAEAHEAEVVRREEERWMEAECRDLGGSREDDHVSLEDLHAPAWSR